MISLPVWPVGRVLGRWGGAHPPAMGASVDGEGENASGGGAGLELFLPRVATCSGVTQDSFALELLALCPCNFPTPARAFP